MAFSVAVVGATGRLGGVVTRVIRAMPDAELVAALGSGDDREAAHTADVVVDVTHPGVSPEIVGAAIAAGRRVLVGTSGWSEERLVDLRRRVGEHRGSGAVVIPNFSLGSVLATGLSTIAARYLDAAEIVETHHAGKVDSPSGTAVRTAELMARERGVFAAPHVDQRARGQQVGGIPVHSLRLPGVLARQQVILGGVGETVTIAHETTSDASYEAGIQAGLRRAAVTTDEVLVGLDAVLGMTF